MTTTFETRLDYGILQCDVPAETIGDVVAIDIPEFPGQTEPIAAGRYTFPVSALESATLSEVWSLDESRNDLNANGMRFAVSHGDRGKVGTGEWIPAVIFGRFDDDKHVGPSAQFGRIEWINGRYTYTDSRVIELTRIVG